MRRDVDLGDKEVTLIGTAHISEESKKEVEETIRELKPDHVFVELDEDRLSSLRGDSRWKDLDIIEAIKEGKGYMLFLNIILSIYQRNLGLKENLTPGQELLAAVNVAEEENIEYGLIDRNINDTLRRLREELTIWEKIKLMSSLLAYPFVPEEELDVEELKQQDIISALVKELDEEFPTLKKVFLDERNSFMAEKILEEDFNHAVVVVGAAHVEGLEEDLLNEKKHTTEVKESHFPWFKVINYGLPALILGMIGYSFLFMDFETGALAVSTWVVLNGFMSFLGAMIAKSHPVTWAASFVSAPLTSLYPVIGAGFVGAYVEGRLYPPTVEEMEEITEMTDYKQLWDNQLGRIILTFVFVSLGSALATLIGAGLIFSIIAWI